MNVFISWSQERSNAVAQALYDWIPTIIQSVKPWMSDHDIAKGTRGLPAIAKELEAANFGIICLTPENLTAPWLLFEAGALSKRQDDARLWTLLYDLEHTDVTGPLAQFQHTKTEKEDVWRLLQAINTAQNAPLITDEQLRKAFDRGWQELDDKLNAIPAQNERLPERSQQDMVVEILEVVRGLARSNSDRSGNDNVSRFAWDGERFAPIGDASTARRTPGTHDSMSQVYERAFATMLANVAAAHENISRNDQVTSLKYGRGTVSGTGNGKFHVVFNDGRRVQFSCGDADIIDITKHSDAIDNDPFEEHN